MIDQFKFFSATGPSSQTKADTEIQYIKQQRCIVSSLGIESVGPYAGLLPTRYSLPCGFANHSTGWILYVLRLLKLQNSDSHLSPLWPRVDITGLLVSVRNSVSLGHTSRSHQYTWDEVMTTCTSVNWPWWKLLTYFTEVNIWMVKS